MSGISKNDLVGIIATLLVLGLVAAVSPVEKTLGVNVRLVYLHGEGLQPGRFVEVKIDGYMEYDLVGEVVE